MLLERDRVDDAEKLLRNILGYVESTQVCGVTAFGPLLRDISANGGQGTPCSAALWQALPGHQPSFGPPCSWLTSNRHLAYLAWH